MMFLDKRLLSLARPVRGWILLTLLFRLAVSATRVGQVVLLAHIVVDVVVESASWREVGTPLCWLAGLVVARAVLLWVATVVSEQTAHVTVRVLREQAFGRLLALGPGHMSGQRTGEARSAIVDGVEAMAPFYSGYLPGLVHSLLVPLGIVGYLATVDIWVAMIALVAVAFAVLAPLVVQELLARSGGEDRVWQQIGDFDAEFVDTVQGLTTLKAFGAMSRRRAVIDERAERVRLAVMRELRVGLGHLALQSVGTIGGGVAMLVYAVSASLEPYALVIVLFLVAELFRPISELTKLVHDAFGAISAAKSIGTLLDAAPPAPEPAGGTVQSVRPALSFEKVSFTYPGRDRRAVDQVSLDVAEGETVAVVGPSGSGKSTLVNLILRFVDPDLGAVRMGGHDLRTLPSATIRQMVSLVAQDTYLFHGTIAENIALGRPGATRSDVEAAARAAGVHGFIGELPQGYDTPVGERGTQLSGGQRQRIAIARAVLKDAPILILDEATSSVDARNEATIQAALDQIMSGRTTLVIAHRLSTIRDAGRILVLDGGRVVQTGTHESLVDSGGLYAQLVHAQAEGALR
jgi:ABC-type multidrug transport system fused ATPase/permease subunit